MIDVKSRKKIKRKVSGGRTVIHFRKKKPGIMICGMCGARLSRKRLNPINLKRISKNQRRAERPLPNLCSKCMRRQLKNTVR